MDLSAITINGLPLASAPLLTEWQSVTIACVPFGATTEVRLRIGTTDLGRPQITLGTRDWHWHWNPENSVGVFPARLHIGEHEVPFDLTVVPSKLRLDHYAELLAALQQTALGLVLALGGGLIGATAGLATPATLLATWPQVQAQVAQVIAVTHAIAARPHQTTQTHTQRQLLHELRMIDPQTLGDLLREPLDEVSADHLPSLQAALRPADQQQGGPLPQRLASSSQRTTLDCLEHRLLHTLLVQLSQRVAAIGAVMQAEQQRRSLSGLEQQQLIVWLEAQRRSARELRRLRQSPLLAEVGMQAQCTAPTHLMRHDPRYRQLWHLWRWLRGEPQLACDSPVFYLPLADLPTLYEQWCVLATISALIPLGTLVSQQILSYPADRQLPWRLRLTENQPLVVVGLPHGVEASVFYHRRYRAQIGHTAALGSLDPFVRIPDIAIELQRPGQPPRTLLLDAKYRVMPDGEIPQTALDTAYTYHGAIGYAGQRATLGAWLLFPGSRPINAGPIGAIPLLPQTTSGLHALVQHVLGDV